MPTLSPLFEMCAIVDSSRQGVNMAEIDSKGDFARNLNAKLQNETG